MKQISTTEAAYAVAVKAANHAMSGFVGMSDKIKELFNITPEMESAAYELMKPSTQKMIATSIHADISNFAYAECKRIQQETAMDIYIYQACNESISRSY